MKLQRLRHLFAWMVSAVLGFVQLAPAQKPPTDPISVTMTLGWQNCCREGEWTPMEIVASSQVDRPFIGQIELSFPQDRQHQMIIRHPLVLMPAQSVKVPLVVKMSSVTDTCHIRMVDRDGNVFLSQSIELYDFRRGRTGVTIIRDPDTLVVSCGKGGLSLPYAGRINQGQGQFYTCAAMANSLPCVWTGYKALNVLILYDPDWSQMNPAQHQALTQWVTNGGRVMIILGAKGLPPDSPVSTMIPFKPGPPRKTQLSYNTLVQWSTPNDPTPGVAAWKFPREPLPAGWTSVTTDAAGDPLIVKGHVGFGQVVLCAFDLKRLAPAEEAKALKFWNTHLEPLLELNNRQVDQKADVQPGQPGFIPPGRGMWTPPDPGLNNVLSHLMNITELEPISIWWIMLILGSMAVLIGPVDYIVLKRLDRLPWTYITFLTILAVFTTGAYFGVQFLRAGNDQLRRVSIIDKVDGANVVWQTDYTGIFASRSDDYIFTGFPGDSWWSGITPSQMYYNDGGSSIKSIIECTQQEGNVLQSLPVNIWSMRTLVNEQPAKEFPLSADITYTDGKITAVLRNTGQGTIDSGAVRLRDMWWEFGAIAPGQSVTIKAGPNHRSANHPFWAQISDPQRQQISSMDGVLQPWLAFVAYGVTPRTQGIEQRAAAGEAVVYAAVSDPACCPVRMKTKHPVVTNTIYLRLIVPNIKTGSSS